MIILITGISGYIGGRLAGLLRERGHVVRGIDRRPATVPDLDGFVQADLRDSPRLAEALGGVEAVFHLAAARGDFGIADEHYRRDNVDATQVLVEHGRKEGITRWVHYSSVSAMGPSAVHVDERAALRPTTPYGASKAEAERLFHRLAEDDPTVSVLVLRPSVVYGPGNFADTNVYRLIRAIDEKRFVMIGDGRTLKTVSYIDNVLAATLFCWDRMQPGVQTYIYVDQPILSTEEIVRRICALLGRSIPAWRLPRAVAVGLASALDVVAAVTGVDVPITAARIRKFCTSTVFDGEAIRRLGFHQPASNDAALEATVRWYRSTVAR